MAKIKKLSNAIPGEEPKKKKKKGKEAAGEETDEGVQELTGDESGSFCFFFKNTILEADFPILAIFGQTLEVFPITLNWGLTGYRISGLFFL